MGCDCTNYFPKDTKKKEIDEFLVLMGYRRGEKGPLNVKRGTPYHFYKDDDYKYITGIYAELYESKEKSCLALWTRTSIWRSKYDSDFHNYTAKQLKKMFGGHFISDLGKNKYFKFDGPIREKAEAGFYQSYSYFSTNMRRALHFVDFAGLLKDDTYKILNIASLDTLNPKIVSTNILIPFVVSALEDYFRSSYIALLRYSDKRERVIQNAKIRGQELVAIDQGILTVPEAVAKWLSFQDMNKVNAAFRELDARIDLFGILKAPYGRRRETFWDILIRLIEQRHELIHQANLNPSYYPEKVNKDVELVKMAIWRVYSKIISLYKWQPVEKWEF